MEATYAPSSFPDAVHLHETTVIDRETGIGLAITVVPSDALPSDPREMFERLVD